MTLLKNHVISTVTVHTIKGLLQSDLGGSSHLASS